MNNHQLYPDSYKFPLLWNNCSEDAVKMFFPDLPGCEFTVPRNFRVTDALEKAGEKLSVHLYQMEKDKQPVPRPTPLYKLTKEPGTGIYVIAAMTHLREAESHEKDTEPVVTQLSILDFGCTKTCDVLNGDTGDPVKLNTFKREAYTKPETKSNGLPEGKNPGSSLASLKISPLLPAKKITQLALWKALIICVLALLIGGGIFNFNKIAGSYKPWELYYSQKPAAAGTPADTHSD